ncbi:MAG: universal stress protein [Burkholderiaceae bacterium]|nr:universal stress protein [Burkholderiaceae bacterium]
MYQHLLVPIDGTDLSTEVIGHAVDLARRLGARITFFHAVADHSASLRGDVDVVRLTAGADYAYAFQGRARELLAKAEAAARAFAVPCDTLHEVNDKPAAAIIGAARRSGCDLIFMASHGSRTKLGMALASETLQVLMTAGLPVLVSATGDPKPPAHAIGVIRDEHRSLAAVLHAWMHLLAGARHRGQPADPKLVRAIVHYLKAFPLALHHPKEDEYLFKRLRERTTSVHADLDELERQHQRDHQLLDELAQLVEAWATASDPAAAQRCLASLDEAVQRYASFLWDHMGREEGVILPAAQRHLTAEDWQQIDAAFSVNRDPQFGASTETDKEYKQLFSRIVNLVEA